MTEVPTGRQSRRQADAWQTRSRPRRSETMIDGITWFKQSAFLFQRERNLYIDPLGITDDAPMADAILITHAHFDHFSQVHIAKVRQDSTPVYATPDLASQLAVTA